MKGKLEISIEVPECEFVEWCLNMSSSGYDTFPIMVIYALGENWNINKLSYYHKLIYGRKGNDK